MHLSDLYLELALWNCHQVNATRLDMSWYVTSEPGAVKQRTISWTNVEDTMQHHWTTMNSLALVSSESVIFKVILWIDILGVSRKIVVRWMS